MAGIITRLDVVGQKVDLMEEPSCAVFPAIQREKLGTVRYFEESHNHVTDASILSSFQWAPSASVHAYFLPKPDALHTPSVAQVYHHCTHPVRVFLYHTSLSSDHPIPDALSISNSRISSAATPSSVPLSSCLISRSTPPLGLCQHGPPRHMWSRRSFKRL